MPSRVASDTSFKIKRSERCFFVGKTGTGKTTLAKSLMYGQDNVVILDPKHTFELPEAKWKHTTYTKMSQLRKHPDASTAIYRPLLQEMTDNGCDEFFYWAFERGNTLVYVDEAIAVTNGSRIHPGYRTVIQLGREKNVGCWSATQRPKNVPFPLMTESEHYFVFRLASREDRARLHEWIEYEQIMDMPKDEHGFWYYYAPTGKLTYYSRADVGFLVKG